MVVQEFYIPLQSSSIHFLKTKLCVGCPNGFEIVDLETLDTQGLLDPADESLDFVRRRESTLKPMAIYRIENEFLLCYDGAMRSFLSTDDVKLKKCLRIRILRQQDRVAVTSGVHGLLGRFTNRVR